ncbi:alpha-related fimbriae major subunit [Yersinia pseudotuberculosis]|uniref:hypothetical protein n=1 Tax=Yersinia pseudotuberculosis TaxID=633 RepID=UPI0004F7D002|nr:hypothetical protein [Yersinia pseudotuberculosis]AIN14396.1 hypothetical protein DJ40_2188 [Yersinia pseudotuberculosis]AJJ08376.1 putative exported protein [Yersinia pseudotuberculosis]MBO1553810.1 hypothetical protein [Yersinia pseudotuberculosis]MBO1560926.1 hypothetical protein [Yersinia pseudotuberculosis]CNK15018.1 alpha-related fimbriae major subunit [Yersinia pseudotuberculosis]
MNIKNKPLLIGLLLLFLHPTTAAATKWVGNYFYPLANKYSNCNVTLLEDNSVAVSFDVTLIDDLFETDRGPHLQRWKKIIGTQQDVLLVQNNALLFLYFYHADGSADFSIRPGDIQNMSLNGIPVQEIDYNLQEARFVSTHAFSNQSYHVSFNITANALKHIRMGATIGGVLHSEGVSYSVRSPQGVAFNQSGNQCEFFDPTTEIAPSHALYIEPKFRLGSAIWQLKSLDLDHLLDSTADNHGLHAPLVNGPANRFCIHYPAIGTQNRRYMISASNLNGLAESSRYFQLKDNQGEHIINYKVTLKNHEDSEADFSLPKEKKFIQLKSDTSSGGEAQMCWSPRIRVYSTDTTDKGHYTDTLNFTITPLA